MLDKSFDVKDVELFADNLAVLAAETVQKAGSGHPGAPMGMCRIMAELLLNHVNFNPRDPHWLNRDRFVLSAGHASAGLYSFLHLLGYDISLDDLQHFRQLGSKTPGHPERDVDLGIEMTTGPLGQGISTAVGIALGAKNLGACFNTPEHKIIDHKVYVLASEGDLEEGVSYEACSLAGHWGLDNLVVLLDRNHISIDGSTDLSFTEDIMHRFGTQGWFVVEIDGTSVADIRGALDCVHNAIEGQPSLIICRTHIGWRSSKQDSSSAHGEPLGEDILAAFKKNIGWPEESFFVLDEVNTTREALIDKGEEAGTVWKQKFEEYREANQKKAQELERIISGKLPDGWDDDLPTFPLLEKMATRKASGKILETLTARIPEMLGGSADLTPSNNTLVNGFDSIQKAAYGGRYLRYGIREHAMGTIMNGLALEGGVIPYGGTFLVFSDYMRPSIRLAALMGVRVVYVFTHDSIGLGEDGPTHQPIEQLAALRAIPNLHVIRPADANETVAAWRMALEYEGPTALVLSRQNLTIVSHGKYEEVSRGGYVVKSEYRISKSETNSNFQNGEKKDGVEGRADVPSTMTNQTVVESQPDLILVATGSEVSLAVEVAERLEQDGKSVRVVSMPCWEIFRRQEVDYKETVLPKDVRKVAIEAASPFGWHEWVDEVIGIESFGASGQGGEVMAKFGYELRSVVKRFE